jgi:hypothetical protein
VVEVERDDRLGSSGDRCGEDVAIPRVVGHRPLCEPFGVEPTHPDEFLLALYGIAPELVVEEVRQQAADLTNPPWSFEDLIEALERAGGERFADALRTPLASEADDPRG